MIRGLAILFVFLFSLVVCSNQIKAQETANQSNEIAVIARPLKDSIMLRWGPSTSSAWQVLNRTGYLITRSTILRNGELLTKPEKILITLKPIKPLPLELWKPLVNEDQYAPIAAQALYGDDFSIARDDMGNMGEMINKVHENESRFSFALFSADQSFKVAKAMGLSYADHTAKNNENYVYHIYPAIANTSLKIDTGYIYTGFSDYKKLPVPYNLQIEIQEKGVIISWSNELLTNTYTSYIVERSEDGGNKFLSITDAPIVNTINENEASVKTVSKIDTAVSANQKLIYRVKGVSPFGEAGPFSDTISIFIAPKLKAVPNIISTRFTKNNQINIKWDIQESEVEIAGFDLERSISPTTGFKKINDQIIKNDSREYIDAAPLSSNYYRLKAYGKSNNSTTSFPVFIQLVDSIPPNRPKFIKGEATKNGIVKLSWEVNTELDIYGYRIYRSNTKNGEFSQVSRKPVLLTNFTDTIEIKTLSKKIHYRIVAIDKHFNPSEFSETVTIDRPDIIPPAPPSITKVKSAPDGIYLAWVRSSSDDILKHEVYRTRQEDTNWKPIAEFSDTTSAYIDINDENDIVYIYKIKAIDKNLLSSESQSFTAKRIDLGVKPDIISFNGYAERENLQIVLKWIYKQAGIESFLLYKAEANKPIRLYKTLDADKKEFIDKELFINTVYHYQLKAIFMDGSESGFTTFKLNY